MPTRFAFSPTELPEVLQIEYLAFGDERGWFAETFREADFVEAGVRARLVQDNQSRSARGTLRGLHYQLDPHAQGKLVRCARGRIYDVAVDLRRGSPRFGKQAARELSDDNRRMLWIPPGFAHGFYVLGEAADVVYRQTDYWAPGLERGIRYDDLDLAIPWPLSGPPILSPKDSTYPAFKEAEVNYEYRP